MQILYSRSTMMLTAIAKNFETQAPVEDATVTAVLTTEADAAVKLLNGSELGEQTLAETATAGRYRVKLPATLDEAGTPPAWAVVKIVKDDDQHTVRMRITVIDDTV